MKSYLLVFCLSFNFFNAFATNYIDIDKQSARVPANLQTAPEIALYLTKNLRTPEEKVRAIYYWIAHTIRYDVTQMKSNDYSYTYGERDLLQEVLTKRQGVCQHYAILFNALCQVAGIQSYVVYGYSSQNGVIANLSHAWNAVCINGKYSEIDATWAAGYLVDGTFSQQFTDEFFMISPAVFIKTHIPFDPIWQFLDNPITHSEFEKRDFSRIGKSGAFNYEDSIKAQSELDTLQNLIRINKRIRIFEMTNNMIRNFVYFNQQNILQLKYNQAVKYFNRGIEDYNLYILAKNKQFSSSAMNEANILDLLSSSKINTEKAQNSIIFLSGNNEVLNSNILKMNNEIDQMKQKLTVEDEFMKVYLATWKPLRKTLFYKISINHP